MNAYSQRSDPMRVGWLKLLKEPVLIVIKHILAKPQKKKIIAINTDQNENRMKFSAKLVSTSAIMD